MPFHSAACESSPGKGENCVQTTITTMSVVKIEPSDCRCFCVLPRFANANAASKGAAKIMMAIYLIG